MVRRSRMTFRLERERTQRFGGPIAGVDEAGRGPWAGPVVAAAVVLDPDNIPEGIADSKTLSAAARERLYRDITVSAQVGIAIADADRIDRDNILEATLWAMAAAVSQLPTAPSLTLVDGNRCPPLAGAAEVIIRGDAICLSIAAASIIAKVTRDRLMCAFAQSWPAYGFERHKGYGTRAHAEALARYGVTPLHRRSFKPVRTLLAGGGIAAADVAELAPADRDEAGPPA